MFARFKRQPLKTFQLFDWARAAYTDVSYVQLHDFIPSTFAWGTKQELSGQWTYTHESVNNAITNRQVFHLTDAPALDFTKIDTFKLIKLDGGSADAAKDPPKEIRNDYDEEMEAARDDVRLFAIFLDDYLVRRGTSMAVRGQLSKFMQTQIGPSDMVGVMYPLQPTASVRMTRNHSAVARGLEQFLGRKFDYTPRNTFEEQYANYPASVVENVRNQITMGALKGAAVRMAGLREGRKSIIFVSEGFTAMLPILSWWPR